MAEFTVRPIEAEEKEVWDTFVGECTQSSVFHYYDWLRCAEEESGYKLEALEVSKQGHGKVCQFPIFFKSKKGVRMAVSPPPGCAIPYLGPIFRFSGEHQSSVETEHKLVVRKLLEYLESQSIDYYRLVSPPEVVDVRPFTWSGFSASVNYTYRMSLDQIDKDDLLSLFDKKVRKMVRKFERSYPSAYTKPLPINHIVDRIKNRYEQKERHHGVTENYFNRLIEVFPRYVQPIGVHENGELITGTILLKHKKLIQAWTGSSKVPASYNGSNEYLRKEIISQSLEDGFSEFESVGANTPHLCENKSKYNFRPVPYYKLEKKNRKARLAEYIAQKFGIRGSDI